MCAADMGRAHHRFALCKTAGLKDMIETGQTRPYLKLRDQMAPSCWYLLESAIALQTRVDYTHLEPQNFDDMLAAELAKIC